MDRSQTLLIFDLDETLVFGTEEPLQRQADLKAGAFHIYIRPGARELIGGCARIYRLGVWTASSRAYATPIVAHLFAKHPLDVFWTPEGAPPTCLLSYGVYMSGMHHKLAPQPCAPSHTAIHARAPSPWGFWRQPPTAVCQTRSPE